MKIGFSFGRCVRDIVNGEVDIDDVVMLLCRTYMKTREHVEGVVDEYMYIPGYLDGLDRDQCLDVAHQLWDDGKIHQPRIYGVNYRSRGEEHLWMDLFPTTNDVSPMVQEAWDNYRMTLGLLHMDKVPTEGNNESDYRR